MRLRVLSICKSLPTPSNQSYGVFVLRRLQALSRLAQVRVVQPVPFFPLLRPLPDWAKSCRAGGQLTIEPAPMPYFPGVLKRLDGWLLGRAVLKHAPAADLRTAVDLIDAHFGYPDGVGALQVARSAGLPAFITVRGLETDYLKSDQTRGQLVRALHQAAGCICVSHSLRALIVDHGVNPQATRVIPNGIDRSMFRPDGKPAARAGLDIGMDGRLIVSVGTLIALKRHHVLIQAMPDILRSYRDAKLVILGGERDESSYLTHLRDLAGGLGVAHAVRFAGSLPPDRVCAWLQAADVFALGTSREGCCNAVLEALSTGVPVVTTPVGDNAHYVRDGVNGVLVPVDDVTAMGQGVVRALARHWDAKQISDGLAVGSWDAVAASVVDFYRERLRVWPGYSQYRR